MQKNRRLSLSSQQTWQEFFDKAEQVFALCLEQTEPLFFPESAVADLSLAFKPHHMHTVKSGQNQKKRLQKAFQKNSVLKKNLEEQSNNCSMEEAIKQSYARTGQALEKTGEPPSESGLIQRLDYETAGLLLQAPNRERQQYLRGLQKAQKIKKLYLAWSPFYPSDDAPNEPLSRPLGYLAAPSWPQVLNSYFCSYGPKGSQVRILPTDKGSNKASQKRKAQLCQTKIEAWRPCKNKRDGCFFLVSLHRGFRHQVRVQLAYLGFPLCSDPLYFDLYPPLYSSQNTAAKAQPYPKLGLIACGFEICGQRLSLSI